MFASTAATLFAPTPHASLIAHTAAVTTASSSRASSPSVAPPLPPPLAKRYNLPASARIGREVARRGLYSRFLPGSKATLYTERVPEIEELPVQTNVRISKVIKEAVNGNKVRGNEGDAEEERRASSFVKKRKKGKVTRQFSSEDKGTLRSTPSGNSERQLHVGAKGIGPMEPEKKKRRSDGTNEEPDLKRPSHTAQKRKESVR